MKFVNSIPQSFFTGAGLLRTPNMRGGAAPRPLHSSPCMGAPPHAPGDFLPDEKVTKESPRGVSPLGTPLGGHYHPPSSAPRCSPQKGEGATKGRGICHFDTVKQLAFFSPEAPMEETPTAFKPWRGRGGLMGTGGMGTEEVRFL